MLLNSRQVVAAGPGPRRGLPCLPRPSLRAAWQNTKPAHVAKSWADEVGYKSASSNKPSTEEHAHDTSSSTQWVPAHRAFSQGSPQHKQHTHVNLLSFAGAALLAAPFGPTLLSDMSNQPVFVAQALGVLALIVAVHEAGHFAAARLQGIHVTKFAIGFGPPLVTFNHKEVEYSLRAIPLGGYVAFPDDDENSGFSPDDPDLLRNRSVGERAVVISAGVIANVLFAYLSLLVQVSTVGKAETAYMAGVNMPVVDAGSVADRAGFKSGDRVIRVGDYQLPAAPQQVPKVVDMIKTHPNEELQFTVVRRGEPAPVVVSVVPEASPAGYGRIGVSLTPNTVIEHVKGATVSENLEIVNKEFMRLAGTVLGGLKAIITNFSGVAGQVSGPVAIVAAGADIAKTDSAGLFQFCAIVNLNLAVVNTLPLPALDGGFMVLLLLEAVRGKKLPEKVEQGYMASGFLLLMAMGFSLIIKDTVNLLPGL